MYGQANYGPQFGSGPQAPMPPANQQRPPVPPLPPPPLQYQQGLPAPPPPVNQQATSAMAPQIGQRGPYLYQHGFPAPPPLHQSQPILLSGMPNTGQPYLHPPQTVQGSTLVSQCYSNAQHNVQHPSRTGTQNLYRVPPPSLLSSHGPPPCPDMLQAAAPHGALPPPAAAATQGPTLYKALYSSQQQTGGAQGFQHIPPPPPPPAPNLFTPTTFGSFVHLTVGDSHMPNMAPLPPPPKPSNGSVMFDLSPPPPKPSDEKIVHKIDFFCQLIAKNGPGIEDVTRQNESKNVEFEFLFGGEPGSGAAIANKYFLWMKKKCTLACKLREGQNESPLKSSVIDSSSQPEHLMVSSGCSLHADSDMEMEDDITLSDRDQAVNGSIEALNCKSDLIHEELDVKKQLYGLQSSAEWSTPHSVSCEKVSCSLSSELCKQSEGPDLLFDLGRSTVEKSPSRVDNICSTEDAECPFGNDLEKSTIPRADDQNTFSASAAAEAMHSDELSIQSIKVGSPFRLLQDYASDNSSGNDEKVFTEDVNVVIVPQSVTAGAKSSQKGAGSHLETYIRSESPCITDKVSGPQSEFRKSYKAGKLSLDSETQVKDTSTTVITIESHEAFQEKDALGGAGIDIVSKRGKSQEGKKAKFESVPPKVDEYGRLVREGSSDSNSDDSRYNKRHNKRGRNRIRSRSRSRSCSPLDRRRRRRSPRRRREKRSRSRSWSSRNRRSRSRSPTFRRAGEFRDDNKRQDRRHIPECFDFLRGRCYRGASCRYMHHEYDKDDGSSRHTSKQKDLEFQPSLKNSRIKEEIKPTNLHDEFKGQEMQLCQEVPFATKDGQWIDPDKINCESYRVAAATMQLEQIIQEKLEETTTQIPDNKEFQEVLESHHPSVQLICGADNMKSCADTSQDVLPRMKVSINEQSQSNNPVAKLQKDDCRSQKMEDALISDSSPVQGSKTSANKVSSSEPLPNTILSTHPWPIKSSNNEPLSSEQFSSQFMAPKESSLPSFSAANIPCSSQLPPPPPLSLVHGASATHVPQLQRMPPYPLQSTPTGSIHSYQDPLPNQHAQFSLPPDSLWTSLPPPPPRPLYDSSLNVGTSAQGVSSQFQQNNLVPRNDFSSQNSVRPYPIGLPSHSQVGEFLHQMYPPVREHPRPLLHREDYGSGKPSSQSFGVPGLMREDRFTHAPLQDLKSSNSFAHGNIHPQPAPSSRELTMNKMQNFSGDNFPSGELLNSSLQIHTRPQSQQPTYGVQHPIGDSILGMPGKTGVQYPVDDSILGVPGKDGPMSRHPPDLLDRNQLSRLPDFGASRIPTHHNPYAATFEQPLSSKFSSNFLNQEKDAPCGNIFGTPFILSQVPVDGQVVGSVGSRQTTSSPSSARAVSQLLPKSDGEQYDPLFDGIEPSPNLLNKNDHGQKHKPTSESNIMVRLSGSCKPLDVEENSKNKEVGTVASATSVDNDEYGETADAEVGVVEDETPSNTNTDDAVNMAAGDIEIDQVESQGKSKKKKDSRSMRLFKTAVADFVKEFLKPSWRQGNMSKEAFKTIVKKTVDKVSGAMKSHQIPKSQAKINHYIDSSRRKLSKLVMGYVEKYVKS